MEEPTQPPSQKITPGMPIETQASYREETDISALTVSEVTHDVHGQIEHVTLKKGHLFKKVILVPADRIQQVNPGSEQEGAGTLRINIEEEELTSLTASGTEQLPSEKERHAHNQGVLGQGEQALPTAEGGRERESGFDVRPDPTPSARSWLRDIGPGMLGGLSGNDPSAITAYALTGALTGLSSLWLLLLATPMYIAVLVTCGKIGRITQQGFAEVLHDHYPHALVLLATLVLILANVTLIAADLMAVGSGFQLLLGTGFDGNWFIVPVALLLWYLTVYHSFGVFKKVFLVMSLAFVTYFLSAVLARPNWGAVLLHTVIPHLDSSPHFMSGALALLGATISPYTMYWQVQGEKEEQRPGSLRQQVRSATFDSMTGALAGNVIAYFMIISTAATLYVQHQPISTLADAALAMSPLLGPSAHALFALGLIGAGCVAIPILLSSTSYAVAGTFGWSAGLSKKPWQSEGFYVMLTGTLLLGVALAVLHMDLVTFLFGANILAAILAPPLVLALFLMGNNRRIMGRTRLGWFSNCWLVFTILILACGSVWLFYGLVAGQT